MSGVVLDASATLPWCFEDEATPETEALLDDLRDGSFAVVPAHWATEVMNGLLVAQRRGRIDAERVARFGVDLSALPIRIEPGHPPTSWNGVIDLAMEHGLTAYDAAYLELALRLELRLATSDQALRRAAMSAGCRL